MVDLSLIWKAHRAASVGSTLEKEGMRLFLQRPQICIISGSPFAHLRTDVTKHLIFRELGARPGTDLPHLPEQDCIDRKSGPTDCARNGNQWQRDICCSLGQNIRISKAQMLMAGVEDSSSEKPMIAHMKPCEKELHGGTSASPKSPSVLASQYFGLLVWQGHVFIIVREGERTVFIWMRVWN